MPEEIQVERIEVLKDRESRDLLAKLFIPKEFPYREEFLEQFRTELHLWKIAKGMMLQKEFEAATSRIFHKLLAEFKERKCDEKEKSS